MQASRCMFSAATALRRVFIHPNELSRTLRLPQPLPQTSRGLAIQRRTYAAPAQRRARRDEEIRDRKIHVVDESGTFLPVQWTKEVLALMNRETHMLVVVNQGEDGEPPVCKIVEKKAFREAEKAKAKAPKSPTSKVKMIELNWAIDGNDLGHRLDKMRQFLAKGWRIEVVLAPRRKGKKASLEECDAILERIKGVTQEVEGSKMWKDMEGKVGAQVTMYFEGKLQKENDSVKP